MTADLDNLGEPPEDDDTTEADRPSKLADQLAGIYDYTRLAELEKDDPERAQEHRDAAHELLGWLDGAPREERRAAFSRGWERAKERRNERAERRINELEDLLASIHPEARTASTTAASWAQARQDPRFELVVREAMGLDRYDGEPVIPRRSMAELLAARVMAVIRAHEAAQQPACGECGHPKDQHGEADDPVSVGQCRQCAAEPGNEDDSWHNYEPKGE